MNKRTVLLAITLAAAGCGGGGNNPDGAPGDTDASVTTDLSGSAATDGGDTGGGDLFVDADAGVAMNCAAAKPLAATGGTVMGDNSKSVNGTSGSCGGVESPEVFYKLVLTQKQLVTVSVAPTMSDTKLQAVVYVRGASCADDASTNEYLCASANNAIGDFDGGAPAGDITATGSAVLDAGTYYIAVDGFGGTAGAFSLTVKVDAPPPPPANESCSSAATLTFTGGMATATADLSTAKDDAHGTCGGMGGPDAVWTFTTSMAQSIDVTVAQDPSAPNYQPVVYLRKACASAAKADELACNDAAGGGTATFHVGYLPAGTWFLWVDSSTMRGGKLSLTARLGAPAPANDTCLMPTPIALTNGAGTAMIDTTTSTDDTSGVCGGSGPDDVYSVVVPSEASMIVTLTPDSSSAMYQPVVYVRAMCDVATDSQACNVASAAGMTARAEAYDLKPGTYFVWVDGYQTTSGKGTLSVKLGAPVPPPANNGCGAPAMLAAGTPVMGDTGPSTDKMAPGSAMTLSSVCDVDFTGNFPGHDQTYLFKPSADGMVTFTVKSDGTWDPALWIEPMTCDATGAACTNAADASTDPTMPETIVMMVKGGQSYYVVVDSGDATQAGPFTLTAQ